VHTAIEIFTGKELKEEEIQPLINNPANVMNLNGDAHESLDQHSSWGIEAIQINNEVRVINLCGVDSNMTCIVQILLPYR
jgi:hypothetical protein